MAQAAKSKSVDPRETPALGTGRPRPQQEFSALSLPPAVPGIETVRAKLWRDIRLHYEFSNPPFGEDITYIARGRRIRPLETDIRNQNEQETVAEVDSLRLRVERLKLRLVGHLARPGRETFESGKAGLALKQKLEGLADNESKLPPQDLTAELNKLLPEEWRLDENVLSGAGKENTDRIGELLFALRVFKPISKAERTGFESCMVHVCEMSRSLRGLRNQGDLLSDEPSPIEQALKESWGRYRVVLKELALCEESGSWFSPSYGLGNKKQRGTDQSSIPFNTDYQRNAFDPVQDLERAIGKFGKPEEKIHRHAYGSESVLTMSGLQAFNLILEMLGKEGEWKDANKACYLRQKDIYFELDPILKQHCTDASVKLEHFDPANVQSLVKMVSKEQPRAIFIAPLALAPELRVSPVTQILKALSDPAIAKIYEERTEAGSARPLFVVIDETATSSLGKWKEELFYKLPRHIRVITFESLVKFQQDGQDLCQGGIVTMIGADVDSSSMRRFRKESGTLMPENLVRKIDLARQPDLVEDRLLRHSRNAAILAQGIEPLASHRGLIKGVSHPSLKSHPDAAIAGAELKGGGPILTVHFNVEGLRSFYSEYLGISFTAQKDGEFRNAEGVAENWNSIAHGYAVLVTKLAEAASLDVYEGTSYGFNATRVAVYHQPWDETVLGLKKNEPLGTRLERPFLRVAAGTENIKDVTLLTEVFRRATAIFDDAIADRCLGELLSALRGLGPRGNDGAFALLSEVTPAPDPFDTSDFEKRLQKRLRY